MCNLYSMTRTPEAVRRLFRVAHKLARSYAAEEMRIVQSGPVREDLLAAERATT
jgi:hypothetical protein